MNLFHVGEPLRRRLMKKKTIRRKQSSANLFLDRTEKEMENH